MKRILLFLITFLIWGKNIKALELTSNAQSAILIEPTTNKIIYEVNKDERRAPASMTKLMTLLLTMEALDEGKINLDDKVLVSANAAGMGGSQVYLEANSKIDVEQIIKGISIASGNDAAVAIAEYIAGSTDEFVNMMNEKVKELGLNNTHFVNVHGLDDDDHYSSAYDMSQIARELLKYEKILEYTSLYEDYLVKEDGTKTWLVNTNKLVRFYDGVDGLKTAGYCLTATALKNNIRFLSVVMGEDTSENRSADTVSMLNYGFTNYKLNTILTKETAVKQAEVKKGKSNKILVYPKEDITDLIKQNEEKDYSYQIDVETLEAPLNSGDIVGSMKVVDDGGELVKEVDLVVQDSIQKHSLGSLFYKYFKKVIGGF